MANTDKMIEAKKLDAERRYHAAYKALREMLEDGEKLNFYTVAERAGVSRTYLYNHPEFRRIIKRFRDMSSINEVKELEELHEKVAREFTNLTYRRRRLEEEWEYVPKKVRRKQTKGED